MSRGRRPPSSAESGRRRRNPTLCSGFRPLDSVRTGWLRQPASNLCFLHGENPKLCSAAGRAYLALPAASSLQLAGRSSESGITSLPGKHSETLFGIGQPGGCLRGSSCLAAARCQDLPETLFASGAWRHQVKMPAAGWQAGGKTASLKKNRTFI